MSGLGEGEIGEGDEGSVEYASVTSCLTVTCLLDDGHAVGGHLSLITVAEPSTAVLGKMKEKIGSRKITKIKIAGMPDCWRSDYFDTTLFDDDGEVRDTYKGLVEVQENQNTGGASNVGAIPSSPVKGAIKDKLGASVDPDDPEEMMGDFTIDFE